MEELEGNPYADQTMSRQFKVQRTRQRQNQQPGVFSRTPGVATPATAAFSFPLRTHHNEEGGRCRARVS